MNTVTRRLVLGVLLVLFAAPTLVQAQVRTISFNEAVQIALEQNVALQNARDDLDLQGMTLQRERADFLPNLNFSSGTGRNWGLTFDQTSFQQVTQTSDNFRMSLSSSVNLFNGFRDVATLTQARHALDANEYTYDRSRQTVLFNVIQRYLQVIISRENIRIQEENLESQRQLLQRVEQLVNVGSQPISQLYQQQANVAQAEFNVLQQQQNFELNKLNLIQVLRLDPLQQYEFEIPDIDNIGLVPQSYEVTSLLEQSFQQRPDWLALRSNLESTREGIRVSKAGYLPSINMSLSTGTTWSSLRQEVIRDDQGIPIGVQDVPFSDQLSNNRSGGLSISLNVPIFDRFFTRNSVESARVNLRKATRAMDDQQQNIANDVQGAYLTYQSLLKQLDVNEKQLVSASQALELEQQRYDVGASTLVELTQARASYVQAQSNRAQVIFQFHFQEKLIEYYVGTLDPSVPLFN